MGGRSLHGHGPSPAGYWPTSACARATNSAGRDGLGAERLEARGHLRGPTDAKSGWTLLRNILRRCPKAAFTTRWSASNGTSGASTEKSIGDDGALDVRRRAERVARHVEERPRAGEELEVDRERPVGLRAVRRDEALRDLLLHHHDGLPDVRAGVEQREEDRRRDVVRQVADDGQRGGSGGYSPSCRPPSSSALPSPRPARPPRAGRAPGSGRGGGERPPGRPRWRRGPGGGAATRPSEHPRPRRSRRRRPPGGTWTASAMACTTAGSARKCCPRRFLGRTDIGRGHPAGVSGQDSAPGIRTSPLRRCRATRYRTVLRRFLT